MYSIGLDYGTNSCRALVVNLESGAELGSAVFSYPSGEQGILVDASDPHLARQNPQDYLDGCVAIIRGALEETAVLESSFCMTKVISIGVDTTGSTVIPVDASGTPLAFIDGFRDNLNAHVWLWKDHTAYKEAEEITALAKRMRPEYLAKCGGTYSSEWWWSKILHLKRIDAEVYAASYSFVEHCDWLTAELCGDTNPVTLKRSVCAAGHKAMYNAEWGGLPDEEFLKELDPAMVDLRGRLYGEAHASDERAGTLSQGWLEALGFSSDMEIAVGVGGFDCHMGAVGAGVKEGTLVKVLGTSTCDITVSGKDLADVPGLCGQVMSSVVPGVLGIEAGQSAVGDLFLWLVNQIVPDSYGSSVDEKFESMAAEIEGLLPGETGLLALDWNNGNRSVLTDVRLSGLLMGQTLHTQAHEIYRAYIEATAYGAYTIIKRMEEYGVAINDVVNTGGLSLKNPVLMQIYADVIGKPMRVSSVDQTCAMGAALLSAVSAGYSDLATLQERSVKYLDVVYEPDAGNHAIYERLYGLYIDLHDSFGADASGNLGHVMKELMDIRDQQCKG